MTTVSISSPDMVYAAESFHVIDAKPAGKATFKPFRMGVSKLYFDAHPVSPQWAQDAVIRLTLDAIRIKGIAARNANQGSFEIPDRLPELLESLATSGRMTKVEIEAWTKEHSGLFATFLTVIRKHAADDKLPAKIQALTDLINKGAAPTPPWSEKEQALLASLFDYLASLEPAQFDSEGDSLFTKLLSKLDSLQTKQASLADSL